MKNIKLASLFSVLSLLAACGGGSDPSVASVAAAAATVPAVTPTPSPVTYTYVTPKAGSQLVFAETIVDNTNTTTKRTVIKNITLVNQDGSFTETENDPANTSLTTVPPLHPLYPSTFNYTNNGMTLSSVTTPFTGAATTCTFSPHANGAPSGLTIAQTWALSYIATCGSSAPVAYAESGSFIGTEAITVPAGTFNAYKFQSTVTWTTSTGTAVAMAITRWRNADSANSHSLKIVRNWTYSNVLPAQYSPTSDTFILQSYQ